MRVVPRWLRDWITQLVPKQESSGAGAVQIGTTDGAVHVVNMAPGAASQADAAMQVGQVHSTVHHNHHVHIYSAPPPAPVPAAPREAQPLTAVHKEVLALMKPLPRDKRIGVLTFMRREFDTAMVKELRPQEVYRVKLYVQQVRQSAARKGNHEPH